MWRLNFYDTRIDFLGKGKLAMILSAVVLLVCLGALLVRGLNLGLDFTGGTAVEVRYLDPVEVPQIRETLAAAGFGDAQVQHFGTSRDVLIRIPPRDQLDAAMLSNQVLEVLRAADGGAGVTLARAEFVGPQVGQELAEQGGLAALGAMIGILIYIIFRFEWRLALGTIAATIHDVIFTVGWFALFQIEFDLTVLAAVLAVIGYSVNDSVVVLDRIRENFRKRRKGSTLEIMNLSINETLTRTIVTSLSTLMAVLVLLFLGGAVMHGFSIALLIGVLVGTYSTIYIASATALYLGVGREDLLPRPKETADERP
ncbi:MAG: protein translocase subunit SecF [Candidatus Competibacteraceae bacterium]|nr:MAG: protein translocase subunit SecF [Candidatus Competibacteraceae bacterium]